MKPNIVQALEWKVSVMAKAFAAFPDAINVPSKSLKYQSIDAYILEHGQVFNNTNPPPKIKRGKMGYCFHNSWNYIGDREHLDLTYVEGMAGVPGKIEVLHAWAVDKHGNVIDPTWKYHPDIEYIGIPFDWKWFNRHVAETGYVGAMQRQEHKILKGNWEYKRAEQFPKAA
jgi:hypothetical protein